MEDKPNKLDSIWRNPDGTFKKGHPQTSEGRPKVKTLKEYAREFLATLPEDQKTEFLSALQPDIVWKMAEGLPQQDITSGGEAIIPIPLLNYVRDNISNKQNTTTDQENKNSTGGNVSEQNSINTNLPDFTKSAGQDTNADQRSVGELPTPTQGS